MNKPLLKTEFYRKDADKIRIMEIRCKNTNKSQSEWWVKTGDVVNGESVWIKMILI